MKKLFKILIIALMILATFVALLGCIEPSEEGDSSTDIPTDEGTGNGGSEGDGSEDDNTPPTTIPDKDGISGSDNLFVFELNESKDGVILTSVNVKNPVVVIPDGSQGKPIKEIGEGVFHANQILEEVVIPASVEKIGARAFSSSYSLKKVTFKENSSLKAIGYRAFYNAEYLESINLPEGLVEIEGGAFELCVTLNNLTLPSTLSKIGTKALHSAWFDAQEEGLVVVNNVAYSYKAGEDIVSLTIPSTIVSIADEAFYGNSKLSAIYIPRSVTSIGSKALCNLPELLTIGVSVENEVYSSEGNCLVEKATNKLLASTKSTIIPASIKVIGEEAFAYNLAIGEITIPSAVESIEKGAFKCSGITKIILPNGLKVIEEDLFLDAEKLASVNIPSSVEEIKRASFNGCLSLEEVIIDSGEILELCIGKLNSPAGLMAYAKVVYVNENVEEISDYLTAFFEEKTSDKAGYKKYVINP